MTTMPGGTGRKMAATGTDADLRAVLLQHDSHINNLNGRIGHVEKTLEGHGNVLQVIKEAVTRQDARPTFNFHQSVSTVLSLALLLSMVVGGIIWVTQSQFAGIVAEQKGVNTAVSKILEKHDERLDAHGARITQVESAIGRWSTLTVHGKGSR